jgi:hypothetical protein
MLEREALLYQHQQALRAERLDANSVSSGDSSRYAGDRFCFVLTRRLVMNIFIERILAGAM